MNKNMNRTCDDDGTIMGGGGAAAAADFLGVMIEGLRFMEAEFEILFGLRVNWEPVRTVLFKGQPQQQRRAWPQFTVASEELTFGTLPTVVLAWKIGALP